MDNASGIASPTNARPNDNSEFYHGVPNSQNAARTPLTEEEREQLRQDLKNTENEIATLREVLHTRIKDANEIKRKLGLTPWHEITEDVNQSLRSVKQSQAYQRTAEVLSTAGEKTSQKIGQLRSSTAFKSFEEKVGSAYTNVKNIFSPTDDTTVIGEEGVEAKLAASTSIDQLAGHAKPENQTSAPSTQPTTPMNEKAPLK